MKIIRTVLGDIPADQIGATDAHDHLIRSGGPEIKLDPAFLMDDVETAKKEFGRFLDAGGRTMVCMDPIGCGRNVSKMLEVAKAYEGKGNIVMTTGFQKGGNYCPNTSFLATVDTNIVAKYMIAEVAEGMDLNSYNGPYVERTIAKAGVIKAGTSYRIITKLEQKALAVAAITQKETGCPISMHTDFGTMGSEILDEIEKNGGKSEKTVLCHMQRNPDRYYYSSILDRGATICFDEPNKAAYRPDTEIAENICWLLDRGYENQIVLGMDAGRVEGLASYRESVGRANGLEYLLTRFVSQDELYEHYKTVAEAVKIPIVLYNIPARTGCSIAPETVAKLAEIDNIVGAKDSSGNWDNLKAYIELTRDKDFAVISGNDSLILSALKEGGVGGIAGCANVYPHNMVAIYEKFKAGDLEGAQAAQDAIASFRACFKYGNPNTIVKTAVGLLGYPVGKCRKPFYSMSEEGVAALKAVLEENKRNGMN